MGSGTPRAGIALPHLAWLRRRHQLIGGWAITRRLWLIATASYFLAGLFISEVWFGWATEKELQPNIDGLSVDEVLIGLVPGILAVLVARKVSRSRRSHQSHRSRIAH